MGVRGRALKRGFNAPKFGDIFSLHFKCSRPIYQTGIYEHPPRRTRPLMREQGHISNATHEHFKCGSVISLEYQQGIQCMSCTPDTATQPT